MKNKMFRRINIGTTIALSALCLVFLAVFYFTKFNLDRIPSCIGVALVAWAPFVLEKLFRVKFSNFVWVLFNLVIVLSGIVGSCWRGWSLIFMYDKFIHAAVVGYVGSIVGLMLLCLLGDQKKMRPATVVLFCFFCSATIGALWEIYEFVADTFMGQVAQGGKVELPDGTKFTPVNDTMGDIIANSIGGLIFAVHYIVHAATGKNLLMGTMIEDFYSMEFRPRKKKAEPVSDENQELNPEFDSSESSKKIPSKK